VGDATELFCVWEIWDNCASHRTMRGMSKSKKRRRRSSTRNQIVADLRAGVDDTEVASIRWLPWRLDLRGPASPPATSYVGGDFADLLLAPLVYLFFPLLWFPMESLCLLAATPVYWLLRAAGWMSSTVEVKTTAGVSVRTETCGTLRQARRRRDEINQPKVVVEDDRA
jgi:hypothetical protein